MNQTLQADGNVNDESSISSNDDEGHSHNPRQPLSINVHSSSSSTSTTRKTSTSTAAATASALLISASDKAGMQNIDRERINAILLRESGNSTFMQRQRRMDEVTNAKIQDMKKRLHDKDDDEGEWRNKLLQTTIDPLLHQYQNQQRRPLSTCTVIDMDGFFISCHILTQPHLATIPAAVGSSSMISTSNYIARQYGVRAAMPGYLGRLLVEELSGGKESLTLVHSDYGLYRRKSEEVRRILQEYDPRLRMYSLDEAYMDIGPYLNVLLSSSSKGGEHEVIMRELLQRTNSVEEEEDSGGRSNVDPDRYHEAAQTLLRSIRQRVKDVTGLSCSAGLASNFLLAKVASDIHKPNGQHFVGPTEHEIQTFLHPLPCRKINGIGRVMEKTLRDVLDIETVRDLYDHRAEVYYLFKPATAQFLMRACIGYSDNGASLLSSSSSSSSTEGAAKTCEKETDHHHERIHRKGISHERTFTAMSDWVGLCCKLEGITHSLIQDLKKERNLRPKTITLKVKLANFDIVTKTASREVAFFQQGNDSRQSSQDLLDTVHKLLKEAKKSYLTHHSGDSFSVRLLGVRCSNFQVAKDNQVSLDRYRGMMSPVKGAASSPLRCNNHCGVINPYKNSPKRDDYGTRCNTDRNRTVSTSPMKDGSASNIDSISTNFFECPICAVPFTNKQDNAAINAHVDACLNASTVKQLAKEETMFAKSKEVKVKKKRRLADFFNS